MPPRPSPGRHRTPQSFDADRRRLEQEQEQIHLLEEEIKRKEEAARRRLADLPKELAERARKQKELVRLRLVSAPTRADGISLPRDKRHPIHRSPTPGGSRMAERRAARLQFIVLCIVLALILIAIWRSLPS